MAALPDLPDGYSVEYIVVGVGGDEYLRVTSRTATDRVSYSGIIASTTQTQAAATRLQVGLNVVATVANANDGVLMPQPTTADGSLVAEVVVVNEGASTLKLWPYIGDNLGSGADTAVTMAAGTARVYRPVDEGRWLLVATGSGGSGDALVANPLSQFAATTSAQLRGVLSDETGTGAAYFQDGDAGTPSALVGTNITGTATGLTSGITNALKSATTTVDVSAAAAPTSGQVLKATSGTTATWQTIAGGGDALVASTLDQFADVTQTAGQTLAITSSTTLSGGTHSGTNTGDQTSVSGNAGTVTVADAGGDTTTFPMLATAATGSLAPATDAELTYNATTNVLTVPTVAAALTGNASTATALATARAINGTNFDGTAAITVTAAAGTLTGATLAANVLATSITSVGTLASPVMTTPTIGVATATSINKVAVTAPATAATLTIADGATLTVSASATVSNGTHSGTNTGDQTNITGNAATVTTNANLTGPITSVGNATSIASQTGTGTKFVVDTSPTLVTPAIGVATATSVNKITLTAPATAGTLTIIEGTTLSTTATGSVGGTNSGDEASSRRVYVPANEMTTLSGTALLLTSGTIYSVYLGYIPAGTGRPIKFVNFYPTVVGAGAQTAEVGLGSTPNAPTRATNQTVTVLVADGTLDTLTASGTTIKRNTTAFSSGSGYTPSGVHLYALLRVAMATTQPTIAGIRTDFNNGFVLTTAGGAVLAAANTFTGAAGTATSSTNIDGPMLWATEQ